MAPGRDPLAPATVVVQGPGMERWLAQSIARRHGICANTEFRFPRAFLERIFEARETALGEPNDSSWDIRRMAWSIAGLLETFEGDADFAPLARHLEAADGDWRRIQLAHRIAIVFDQYITFRPEWIWEWSKGKAFPEQADARWQGKLFRSLSEMLGGGHFADRARAFLQASKQGESLDPEIRRALDRVFPDRIEIFAVSTLPPLYLSVIDGLASLRDVQLSVLSPSRSYWADLWSEVRAAELGSDTAQPGLPGLFDAVPATPAARLLAGLGRLGGDFQRNLEDRTSGQESDEDRFESPLDLDVRAQVSAEEPSLLTRLQADLLDLDGDAEVEPRIVRGSDDSIQIHLVHGARRELEVVEAALRDAFERDPSLAPEDVIVMAPQIDAIAPDIEAVFGVPDEDGQAIPHRIADRGALRRSPVADCYASLLALLTSRATRSEVLDWLARPPAFERFGLDEAGVERLEDWAIRAGIRFGLDAEHRAALGLDADPAHTWTDGLARLALAHAVGASGDVYAGTAAVPLDPFSEPEVLGGLGDLVDLLRRARGSLARPRPVAAWCSWLSNLLEEACAKTDANAHEHTAIRGWLQDLTTAVAEAGFDSPIPFEAMREQLTDALASSPAPQAFLAGGVTFCELVPLRAIPFRVIVILGLRDEAFPRGRPAPGFDLMAKDSRPGDRSTRADDRYLFLEALLSARDRLILTVPGRDVRDGSDLPPSIVVTELLDVLEASYEPDPSGVESAEPNAKRSLRDQLVVSHPLQSFSPRYFAREGDPRLIGRDAEAYAGARARNEAAAGGTLRQFLDHLPADSNSEASPSASRSLSLDELAHRILRATRYFTRDRLGMRLPHFEEAAEDLDPLDLAPLDRFALGAALLEDLAAGASPEEATDRLAARAVVPSGLLGTLSTRSLRAEVLEIARVAEGRRTSASLPNHEAALQLNTEGLGEVTLTGELDGLSAEGRLEVSFTRIAKRGELDVWIRHLFLCACAEEGLSVAPKSVLVGRSEKKGKLERVVEFAPVENAKAQLSILFEWAWKSDLAPLPFFAASSRVYAMALDKDEDQAWRNAHHAYHGGDSNQGMPEAEQDLDNRRLWEGWSPLEPSGDLPVDYRFDVLARAFFEPLLASRSVVGR